MNIKTFVKIKYHKILVFLILLSEVFVGRSIISKAMQNDDHKRIAILGWGSLINSPRNLE